jgi:DNA-binding HxlR family transcriptional regulator
VSPSSAAGPSPLGRTLLTLGDQWALLILQRAFFTGTRRFADWREQLRVSDSVLAARLRELVDAGLLEPHSYRDAGRTRTEYRLSAPGRELLPFLIAIGDWERTWVELPAPPVRLVHETCGADLVPLLGCGACGAAPVTARDTESHYDPATAFTRVDVARHHRRTVRSQLPRDRLSYCPETMEILGDRWSTMILAAAFLRIRRFADFADRLGIAVSLLSGRLRRFTELGVLAQHEVAGARHEYRLTDKGLAFFPVYAVLVDWGQRHYPGDAPTTMTHRECGRTFTPVLRCAGCGSPVAHDELRVDLHPAEATG